jgi:hypothetical protein
VKDGDEPDMIVEVPDPNGGRRTIIVGNFKSFNYPTDEMGAIFSRWRNMSAHHVPAQMFVPAQMVEHIGLKNVVQGSFSLYEDDVALNWQQRHYRRFKRDDAPPIGLAPAPVAPPAAVRIEPYPAAEFLITAIVPKRRRDALLGDLEERFARDCEKFDLDRARRRYSAGVANILLRLAWPALKRLRWWALLAAAWRLVRH